MQSSCRFRHSVSATPFCVRKVKIPRSRRRRMIHLGRRRRGCSRKASRPGRSTSTHWSCGRCSTVCSVRLSRTISKAGPRSAICARCCATTFTPRAAGSCLSRADASGCENEADESVWEREIMGRLMLLYAEDPSTGLPRLESPEANLSSTDLDVLRREIEPSFERLANGPDGQLLTLDGLDHPSLPQHYRVT